MYEITGTIEGVAPILFSKLTDGNVEQLKKGTGGGKFSDDERKLEALLRYHRDENGAYIPRAMFKQCLLAGCNKANLKEGRMGMASYLEATVFPKGHLYLGKTEPDDIVESWGRRPPKTGAAVIVRYPSFNTGWKADFSLTVVDDRRSPDHIKKALEEGGLLVGMGSWRPEYGRFVVKEWGVNR